MGYTATDVSRSKWFGRRPSIVEEAPPHLSVNPEVVVERDETNKKKTYHYTYEDGTKVDQVVEYTDTDLLFISKINRAVEIEV